MNSPLAPASAGKPFDPAVWQRPPAAYSHCPFWFWNDRLDPAEIVRQIADFQAHGVDAFVIHPRIGLPQDQGWMTPAFFDCMRAALAEAQRRGMWVILYDEGMYPSGSASGLVVARNPEFRSRGLLCLPKGEACAGRRVATVAHAGKPYEIWDAPVDSVVRGLHYVGDESVPSPGEEEPPAADLLNPEAVQCFIEVVYDRFHAELGAYFGNTIKAIFTDEPHPLSRCRTPDAMPGGAAFLDWFRERFGYDFTPHLGSLWFDGPDAAEHRLAYKEAVAARFDETYYRPLSRWCEAHGIALTGHPAEPDELGHLRHFHIPGQDIVWRHIEPGKKTALEGAPSTMAKAAASSAFHGGKERNLNEFAGAFGADLTFRELRWLASWLLIRGCDLLSPHAFYYSVRGPRRGERPPDVGPNSPWWDRYREWEAMTRRLCWLNATFRPACSVAILGDDTRLPWRAAKACFEAQVDFHYLCPADLAGASVQDGVLHVGPGRYRTVIVEEGYRGTLPEGAPMTRWSEGARIPSDWPRGATFAPISSSLRTRHLRQGSTDVFLIFNEGEEEWTGRVTFPVRGERLRLDPHSGSIEPDEETPALRLPAHGWAVFAVEAI